MDLLFGEKQQNSSDGVGAGGDHLKGLSQQVLTSAPSRSQESDAVALSVVFMKKQDFIDRRVECAV